MQRIVDKFSNLCFSELGMGRICPASHGWLHAQLST